MAVAKKKKPAKKKAVKKTAKKKPAVKRTTARKKPVARKKAAKKPTARKATARRTTTRKPAVKKAKAKRKPNPAFMRPWALSEDLGAVVGMKPMPRTEVTKKLWAYIKKNNLQDTVNRRMINADEKLKKIFGGKKKVSMFEMTKLVSKHLK